MMLCQLLTTSAASLYRIFINSGVVFPYILSVLNSSMCPVRGVHCLLTSLIIETKRLTLTKNIISETVSIFSESDKTVEIIDLTRSPEIQLQAKLLSGRLETENESRK